MRYNRDVFLKMIVLIVAKTFSFAIIDFRYLSWIVSLFVIDFLAPLVIFFDNTICFLVISAWLSTFLLFTKVCFENFCRRFITLTCIFFCESSLISFVVVFYKLSLLLNILFVIIYFICVSISSLNISFKA